MTTMETTVDMFTATFKEFEELSYRERESRLYDQMYRAENVFVPLPYTTGNVISGVSLPDVSFMKNGFINDFAKWGDAVVKRVIPEKRPGNTFLFVGALCDWVESEGVICDTASDLMSLGKLFSSNLYFLFDKPIEVKHFIDNGTFLDVIEWFGQDDMWNQNEDVLVAFEKFYGYEVTMKQKSERDEDDMYENFLSVPIEIRASLSGCEPHRFNEEEEPV